MNELDANAYSTIFSFLSLIASTVTSIIAIVISVKTLKQNNKMIEDSNRPVISFYSKFTDGMLHIVMKNFGNTPCVIDKVSTNMNITKEEEQAFIGNPYDKMNGATLPPNGKVICSFVAYRLKTDIFNFTVKYHSSTHRYEDTFTINWKADDPFPDLHSSVKSTEKSLEKISHTLEDIYKNKI